MYLLTEATSTNLFDAKHAAKRRADLLAEFIARTGDTDKFDVDATADQIEDGLRDFHAAVAEDREHQRAEWRARNGRGGF